MKLEGRGLSTHQDFQCNEIWTACMMGEGGRYWMGIEVSELVSCNKIYVDSTV